MDGGSSCLQWLPTRGFLDQCSHAGAATILAVVVWINIYIRQDNLPDWCQPFWPFPTDEAAFAPVEEGGQCARVSWGKSCYRVFSCTHWGKCQTSMITMMVIVQKIMKEVVSECSCVSWVKVIGVGTK